MNQFQVSTFFFSLLYNNINSYRSGFKSIGIVYLARQSSWNVYKLIYRAYRPFQIGSSLCKILVITIINRIQLWYESQLTDQQQGFRVGRGTANGIYITKRIHQITDKMRKPVYAAFIDFSAVFDHVERDLIFRSIIKLFIVNAETKLITLLQSLYTSSTQTMLNMILNHILYRITKTLKYPWPICGLVNLNSKINLCFFQSRVTNS